MFEILFAILISMLSLICLLWVLRSDPISVGLPAAYLFVLFMEHLPGALSHAVGIEISAGLGGAFYDTEWIQSGITLTSFGSIGFTVGVWWARFRKRTVPIVRAAARSQFWYFCLIVGWLLLLVFRFVRGLPTVTGLIDRGSTVWMLGALLGLRSAVQRGSAIGSWIWLAVLAAFPTSVLLYGGFLSYGAQAVIVVLSPLAITAKSKWRLIGSVGIILFFGLTVFANYFINRDKLRDVLWSEATLEDRIDVVTDVIKNFEWFDPGNESHRDALNQRLNQNYFIGIAAERIKQQDSNYIYGRSVWEALLSLVPRFIWPEKPVFGGSGDIVAEMTGLELSTSTSWGVGQVLEFYINFGTPGVILGFFLLGWLIRLLDFQAAAAETNGDFRGALCFFLPAVALIQPTGSMVEITGGAGAALIMAYGLAWIWGVWSSFTVHAREPNDPSPVKE